jgi:nucleoside-diphosphate-sugar epimerase
MASNIIGRDDLILVTGATGFIGSRLVQTLVGQGFRNLRCFARPSTDVVKVEALLRLRSSARVEVLKGNLLSRAECIAATADGAVVFHLAAGTGMESFPDAFMNSVLTTRTSWKALCRISVCADSSTSARSRSTATRTSPAGGC